MVRTQKNAICLDGADWYSNWFVTNDEVIKNKSTRHIRNQEMDSGESAKVFSPEYSTRGWMQGTVPGCARSFLIENNEIPDPYYGRNCEQSLWVEDKSWWFRKEFEVPSNWLGRKFILKFLGLDYACDIYLNGQLIASHIGMFLQRELDVTDVIQAGNKNVLAVGFLPAPKAEPHHSLNETVTEFAQYHRCQMSWGRDWSRHLVPTGIWDSVYLESYENLRINDMWCRWNNEILEVELDISCTEAAEYKFHLDVSPENFNGVSYKLDTTEKLISGRQKATFNIEVKEPELWHPNGIGAQNLYNVSVQTQDITKQQLFGFRQIEMLKNHSAEENAYPLTFCVNETKIFARGGNWVPADLMPSRLGYEDYDRLIRLAAEAGMNMLRIWGGGLIEKDAFYECCDRRGIMVWQEFPHSCSKYPQDKEYLDFKKLEAVNIIKRIRNHPSLSLWCGGNEMQYYGEKPDSPLLEQYRRLVNTYCPDLPFHVTSPDLSRPGERPHGPWKFMEHDFYNEHKRQLASEIGCPGMSEIESVRKFIPENEPWPDGPAFKYHFLITHNQHSIMNCLEEFDIGSLDELCQASQMAQADALGYIMEHYRCLWPEASGCFIWQYNEPWPTLAWSLVDWHSYPKATYYRLKKSCAPVMLRLKDDSWDIKDGKFKAELWAVNDEYNSGEDFEVNFSLMTASGEIIVDKAFKTSMLFNIPQKLCEFDESISASGDDIIFAFLRLKLNGEMIFSAERVYGYNGFRRLFKMSQTGIMVKKLGEMQTDSGLRLNFEVTNYSDTIAGGIRLAIPDIPVKKTFWEDNYFCLKPGEKRNISVSISCPVRLLNVELNAWNYSRKQFAFKCNSEKSCEHNNPQNISHIHIKEPRSLAIQEK